MNAAFLATVALEGVADDPEIRGLARNLDVGYPSRPD